MIDALWSVVFESSLGMHGSGVAVFNGGRVLGGDSSMIYTGNYTTNGDQITGRLHVEKYAEQPGMASVVGLNIFSMAVSGKVALNDMVLRGQVEGRPELSMTIKAKRRAELAV